MKLCFFITSNGRPEYYRWQEEAFKRFKFILDYDIILHDNSSTPESIIREQFNSLKIKKLLTNQPNQGYFLGQLNAINNYFNLLKDYDFVIHNVHDCFIMDDRPLYDWLVSLREYPGTGFLTNQFPFHPNSNNYVSRVTMCLATDLFAFDPKVVTKEFWEKTLTHGNIPPELILYKTTQELNVPVLFWSRLFVTKKGHTLTAPKPSDLEGLDYRHFPDTMSMMHCENIERLKEYFSHGAAGN